MRTVHPTKAQQVKTLLEEGKLTHRDIAKVCRVSRGIVSSIWNGSWKPAKQYQPDQEFPSGEYVRCPTCKHMVKMPCLYCKLTNET